MSSPSAALSPPLEMKLCSSSERQLSSVVDFTFQGNRPYSAACLAQPPFARHLGDVCPKGAMAARALDADEHAVVYRCPVRVVGTAVCAVHVPRQRVELLQPRCQHENARNHANGSWHSQDDANGSWVLSGIFGSLRGAVADSGIGAGCVAVNVKRRSALVRKIGFHS